MLALGQHRGDPLLGESFGHQERQRRQRQHGAAESELVGQPVAQPHPRLALLAQNGMGPQGERRIVELVEQGRRQDQGVHHHPVEGAAPGAVQETPGERPGAARQRVEGEKGALLLQQVQVVGDQRLALEQLGVGRGQLRAGGDQRIAAGGADQRVGHHGLADRAERQQGAVIGRFSSQAITSSLRKVSLSRSAAAIDAELGGQRLERRRRVFGRIEGGVDGAAGGRALGPFDHVFEKQPAEMPGIQAFGLGRA